MSDPKPAGQGGGKKEKPELIKTLDGSPPKEPEAGDTPKGPKPDKPELLPNPYGPDTPPKTDIDISKLPPLNDKRFKDDKTPDDEDDILGGGPRGPGGDKGGPEVLALASSGGGSGAGAGIAAPGRRGESMDEVSSMGRAEADGLGNFEIQDVMAQPDVHELGNFEIQDVMALPEPDELGNFEIQDVMASPEPDELGNFEIQD
jgi:hypothetical protein